MLRFLAVAALAATVTAQGPSDRIIGYTASPSPAGSPPALQRQVLCNAAQRLCAAIGAPVSAHAGGAAYDGARQTLWYTQGTRLVETLIDGCSTQCTVSAALALGASSVASGLTLQESTRTLWQLETIHGTAAVHQWSLRGCPPVAGPVCRIPLPTNRHVAGAIALDGRSGFLFYAASIFGTASGPANVVLVASVASPCNVICQFRVDACDPITPLGPITGMAHDTCSDSLYVTDGRNVVQLRKTSSRPCDWQAVSCCTQPPNNQRWYGVDVEPLHPRDIGRSCVGRGCPNCTDMRLVALGDPVIGNQLFGFRVEGGPTGGLAFLAFNIGDCQPHGVAFLCGPIYPALLPPLAIVPMGPLTGSATCRGAVTLPVPVPIDYGLCGGAMCFQGIVLCRTPGSIGGVSLTNGVQVVVDA